MLAVSGLEVAYGRVHVLRGVDLRVGSGEVHAVMGPNGSGKSTLSHVIMGRPGYEVTAGRVTLDGVDLTSVTRAAVARRMAVVPQETRLAFDFSVLEVAVMGRYPHLGAFEIEGPADLALAREALAATG